MRNCSIKLSYKKSLYQLSYFTSLYLTINSNKENFQEKVEIRNFYRKSIDSTTRKIKSSKRNRQATRITFIKKNQKHILSLLLKKIVKKKVQKRKIGEEV